MDQEQKLRWAEDFDSIANRLRDKTEKCPIGHPRHAKNKCVHCLPVLSLAEHVEDLGRQAKLLIEALPAEPAEEVFRG